MHSKFVWFGFSYTLSLTVPVLSTGECKDILDRIITPGMHYVPGPDSCTICICDSGNPKWCKAVLCSPPQDCKSFRLGNSCCEFICLDSLETFTKPVTPGVGPDSTTDLGLRLIAYAVTIILFLSLFFFLIHRFRQRKIRGHQNRQLSEDGRSLGSIGYIAGSLGYLPGSMGYLGAGSQDGHLEFRYEEPPSHYPLWKPPGNYFPRGEAPPPYEEAVASARAEAALAAAVANTTSTPSSSLLTTGHRTIPMNLATRLEPSPPSVPESAESRRSSRLMDIPAPLPMTVEEEGAVAAIRSDAFYEDVLVGPPSSLSTVECFNPSINATLTGKVKSSTTITVILPPAPEPLKTDHPLPPPITEGTATSTTTNNKPSENERTSRLSGSLKLNDLNKGSVDSGACSCSYQCLPPPLPPDDNDDYRSECENCKSTHGSRYYIDQEGDLASPPETMTLHRRPQDYDSEDQGYYRTSLTLPTNTRRSRTGPLHGISGSALHSARDNWFSSMPASSTSSTSSEEE